MTLRELLNTKWVGQSELWLDKLHNQADTSACSIEIAADAIRYGWSYKDKPHTRNARAAHRWRGLHGLVSLGEADAVRGGRRNRTRWSTCAARFPPVTDRRGAGGSSSRIGPATSSCFR